MRPSTGNAPRRARRNSIHLPSFQEMSIIEGKKNEESSNNLTKEKYSNMMKRKAERRRNSLDMMVISTQSDQIRSMLENTMIKVLDGILVEGSPEERLQAIMTKAKESGLSAEKIFSFFQGSSSNDHITKKAFINSLEKLGEHVFVLTDEELTNLVNKFDTDGDGMISLAEFKNYCYHQIPSVPWKAERQRLERTGEMDELKSQLYSKQSDMIPCGEEVHSTTKLFWKNNIDLAIRLFYCEPLDIINIQLWNESTGEDLPSLYVRKSNCAINQHDLNEAITKAVQASDSRTKENDAAVRKKVEWEFYANYLLARLKLKEPLDLLDLDEDKRTTSSTQKLEQSVMPCLCKLTGDTFESLTIQKPLNLGNPPKMNNTSMEDFQNAIESFVEIAKTARLSRQSAQGFLTEVNTRMSRQSVQDVHDLSSMAHQALSEVNENE